MADSNFSYWHSATFNNDGTKILFSDEWGGGGAPKCRATDKPEWGADAIFTLVDRQDDVPELLQAARRRRPRNENCVAHNGSLIPIPGRDIMVQAWYQGGISVFDWTDAAQPEGDRVLRPRPGGLDPDGQRRLLVGVLVQRLHVQLRDRARARHLRADAERATCRRTRSTRPSWCTSTTSTPRTSRSSSGRPTSCRGAGLPRPAGAVERPGVGHDLVRPEDARQGGARSRAPSARTRSRSSPPSSTATRRAPATRPRCARWRRRSAPWRPRAERVAVTRLNQRTLQGPAGSAGP